MAETGKSGAVFSAAVVLLALFVLWEMSIFGTSNSWLTFIFTVIVLVIWVSARHASRNLRGQIDDVSRQLTDTLGRLNGRIGQLESQLQNLKAPPAAESAATPETLSRAAHAASTAAPVSATQAAAPPVRISAPRPASTPTAPPPAPSSPAVRQAVPTNFSFTQMGQTAQAPSRSIFDHFHLSLNFEELLGTNWLSKIGAAILVLGIAFFLAWQLREVGPAGKVLVGWLTGGVLLGAGIYFERNERYRIIARAGVAAGWALFFFTSYAMHHIAAARVLDSTAIDLVLMFVVAAAMVGHTLRYRSQVVTGLAFLLAFGAINVNRVADVYSLTSAVVLAAGVAIVALRMRWFLLEICAMAAAFLNHYLWLRPIIEPMGQHHRAFPEFLPSAAILVSYWAIFRFSYLWREGGPHEQLSAAGALLNTGFLLAVLKYQSVHREWAFWALLVLGALELGLGQLRKTRVRSLPHIVLTVMGACLLLAAIPFRYGPEYVALLWLAEAEAFFLVGVLARETVFRRVGMFAFVPLVGQLISFEVAKVYGARMDGSDVKGEFVPALICAFVALVIYLDAHWAPRRWSSQFEHIIEQRTLRDLSYATAALALASGWMAFYFSGTAVAWMALACILALVGQRFQVPQLRVQSLLLAAFSFIRVLVVNLPSAGAAHVLGLHWSARLVTTSAATILCYMAAARRRREESWLSNVESGLSWIASSMLTLLVWYELKSASVALAWGTFALIVLEIGLARRSLNLRLQAYVAAAFVFLRIVFVNLNATSIRGLAPRIYTIVPLLVLFFYFYVRLETQPDLSAIENRLKPARLFAWAGTLTAVLLLRFEVPLDWVATAWAAIVFAAIAIAWKTHKRLFLHQALFVSVGVLARGVLHNLYERSYFTSPSHLRSILMVGSTAAILFASLFFAFKLKREPGGKSHWLAQILDFIDARPEQLLFFFPLALVTAFLAVELRSGMVTMAWGLEAVAVFVAALWIRERSYRLSALGLLFLCIGKIVAIDIWRLGIRDRAFTFIVLGTLILGVSILYSKNREKVRAFL
jgi:hypothetical protein